MSEQFTVEEINLMCIFNMSSRDAFIAELTEAVPYFDEPGLVETADSILNKLSKMSDADFAALQLYPEYEDYDEDQAYNGEAGSADRWAARPVNERKV